MLRCRTICGLQLAACQLLQVGNDVIRFEHQHVTFQSVEHHFCGVTHQRSRETRAGYRADDCDDRLELMAYARNQRICRAFFDV